MYDFWCVQIFPINIKVTAGSIVTLVSFSSSSIVTYAFNFLFEWSTQGIMFFFFLISILYNFGYINYLVINKKSYNLSFFFVYRIEIIND